MPFLPEAKGVARRYTGCWTLETRGDFLVAVLASTTG